MWDLKRYSDDELKGIIKAARAEQKKRAGSVSVCIQCGAEFFGRADAKFCSGTCRVAHHRAGPQFPAELSSRDRWVRHDRKRPIQPDGRTATSTDPGTWSTLAAARASQKGDGLGFVLNGDGLGVIDLDHCIENGVVAPWAQQIVDANAGTFMEISISGTGIHIWGLLADRPGRVIRDGRNIEVYTTARYIALGKPLAGTSRELRPLRSI